MKHDIYILLHACSNLSSWPPSAALVPSEHISRASIAPSSALLLALLLLLVLLLHLEVFFNLQFESVD